MFDELMNNVVNGSISGIPTIVVMMIPLVIGLIVGTFTRKLLKIAVVAVIVLAVAIFLGIYSLELSTLQDLVQQHGQEVVAYASLIIGVLPLSVGFLIGAIIGFIRG